MSTVEQMLSRFRELGNIASNPNADAIIRRRATDERLNLVALIEKQRAQDKANLARQERGRQLSDAHNGEVDAVMKEMAQLSNQIVDTPVGSAERERLTTRMLSLRLKLDKLQDQDFLAGV